MLRSLLATAADVRKVGVGGCAVPVIPHFSTKLVLRGLMTAHMIDWITARIPCFHPEPIDGGRVMKLSPNGEIVWEVASRLEVEGSFESNLLIRTWALDPDGKGNILEISGNPTKWLQGHNLFGGFLQPGPLAELMMYRLVELLPGLQPTDMDRRRWRSGLFDLLRVDVNRMLKLDSRASVRAWLRAAEQSAYMKHRGRGTLTKNGTLYFGQHSRRWSAKFYSKGDELEAGKGHDLPKHIESPGQLLAWATDKLRYEVVLRSMELKDKGLRLASDWSDTTGAELLNGIAKGITMSDLKALPTTAIQSLPTRLLAVYHLWQEGHDLRAMYPKNTFYRYRRQLLPYSVDIAILQPHEDKRSNVVPLIRILEAVPVGPPEWAYGTPLLVGPSDLIDARRRFAAAR